MMSANYDKVIVYDHDGEKVAVVIFNQKTHLPETFGLVKYGMDEHLELLNKKEISA